MKNAAEEKSNVHSPPLKLIRCHEVMSTDSDKLSSLTQNSNNKENLQLTKQTDMTTSHTTKLSKITNKKMQQRKSKASKKLALPSGQKKLTMFFK